MATKKTDHVIIFDFDGTIADVVPMIREIYNDMAKKRNMPELTDDVFENLRKKTLREAIKWIGVKPWQIPGLLNAGRKEFYKKRKEVELFDGCAELIIGLRAENVPVYILSSNSTTTIRSVLRRYEIDDDVEVLKRSSLFGKASSIKRLVRSHGYSKQNVYMIGDEVRDIEAANKAGVNGIAVTWGLQHESILAAAHPKHVVHTVKELSTIIV